jgi:Mn-dependent DtxR family transcriptional regulator
MSTATVARVLEVLVSAVEEALARLAEDEAIEVLEGLQVELDGMLESLIAEGGEEDVDIE